MTYTSIDKYRNERELTSEEVDEIFWNSNTEYWGYAVYDVAEIIVAEGDETEWKPRLWAYRVGDVWTYVPKAFQSITIHWAE